MAPIKVQLDDEQSVRVLTYLKQMQNPFGIPSWDLCMQNEKHKKNQNHVTRSEITRAIILLDPENDARDRC